MKPGNAAGPGAAAARLVACRVETTPSTGMMSGPSLGSPVMLSPSLTLVEIPGITTSGVGKILACAMRLVKRTCGAKSEVRRNVSKAVEHLNTRDWLDRNRY